MSGCMHNNFWPAWHTYGYPLLRTWRTILCFLDSRAACKRSCIHMHTVAQGWRHLNKRLPKLFVTSLQYPPTHQLCLCAYFHLVTFDFHMRSNSLVKGHSVHTEKSPNMVLRVASLFQNCRVAWLCMWIHGQDDAEKRKNWFIRLRTIVNTSLAYINRSASRTHKSSLHLQSATHVIDKANFMQRQSLQLQRASRKRAPHKIGLWPRSCRAKAKVWTQACKTFMHLFIVADCAHRCARRLYLLNQGVCMCVYVCVCMCVFVRDLFHTCRVVAWEVLSVSMSRSLPTRTKQRSIN
jgi:hypothetical protein